MKENNLETKIRKLYNILGWVFLMFIIVIGIAVYLDDNTMLFVGFLGCIGSLAYIYRTNLNYTIKKTEDEVIIKDLKDKIAFLKKSKTNELDFESKAYNLLLLSYLVRNHNKESLKDKSINDLIKKFENGRR